MINQIHWFRSSHWKGFCNFAMKKHCLESTVQLLHDLFEYPQEMDFKIQITSAFTTSALCTCWSSVCCFPSCVLLHKAMLSVGFFAEVKKFCILLTASECFLPFAWSVKADQPAIDNANVLLHTEHQALALLFLSFCTQSLRSISLSQILKSSLLSQFLKKPIFQLFQPFLPLWSPCYYKQLMTHLSIPYFLMKAAIQIFNSVKWMYMLILGFNLSKSYITLLDVSVFEKSKKSECRKSFEAPHWSSGFHSPEKNYNPLYGWPKYKLVYV